MGLPSEANALLGSTDQYRIERSLRFRSGATPTLSRTLTANSTSSTTCTWSVWVKRGALGAARSSIAYNGNTAGNGNMIVLEFASDTLRVFFDGGNTISIVTTAVYRDPTAWYHVVLAYDSTQATASNRARLFVNGVQVTSFSTANYPPLNHAINAASGNVQYIGNSGATPFDGYFAEVNFIDGQALTPSSFGQTDPVTGVWIPRRYAGTYGTNGLYLKFTDNSAATAAAIGRDFSGNGNNFTPTNISVTAGTTFDSMIDSPTNYGDGGNGRGNYAVLSPIDNSGANTLSNANMRATLAAGFSVNSATIAVSSGKWYWEVLPETITANAMIIGVANAAVSASSRVGSTVNGYYYISDGTKYNNNSVTAYGASYTTTDVIGFALDMDAKTITAYKNNVSQGVMFSGLPDVVLPTFQNGTGTGGQVFSANFGQRPFAYTPPAGFRALNTQNLPTPLIERGANHFDTVLYTGDGVNGRTITSSLRFTPGLAWGKSRSTVRAHAMIDSVRGNFLTLSSNATAAESAINSYAVSVANSLLTFNSNETNENGATFVTWLWNRSAVPGFDIVTYTGTGSAQTVAHGLGVAPRMIFTKARNNTLADHWGVYHGSLPNTQNLYLNLTNGAATASMWNSTSPTASVFSLGANNDANRSTINYVAYLWAEVAGFSRFASYVGNGSTDGPFVWCGFRPRFLLLKNVTNVSQWIMVDTARNTFNPITDELVPNAASAENGLAITTSIDALVNGFKIRTADANINQNTDTLVFAAFAENPFKIARAR